MAYGFESNSCAKYLSAKNTNELFKLPRCDVRELARRARTCLSACFKPASAPHRIKNYLNCVLSYHQASEQVMKQSRNKKRANTVDSRVLIR